MNDGGPASDMTLRDYFAARFASAWLSTYPDDQDHPLECRAGPKEVAERHAMLAYRMADAMISIRAKVNTNAEA